jgi:hypothetical protein
MRSDLAGPSLTVVQDEEETRITAWWNLAKKNRDAHAGQADCHSAVRNREWNDRGYTMDVSGRSVSANSPLTSSTSHRPSMVAPNHVLIDHPCHTDVKCSIGHQSSPGCWHETAGCFPNLSIAIHGNSDPPSSDRPAGADAVNCYDARKVAVIQSMRVLRLGHVVSSGDGEHRKGEAGWHVST